MVIDMHKSTNKLNNDNDHSQADPVLLPDGGAIKLMTKTGIQGLSPGGGCKGAEPPCLGKFCISDLNSRDLVHTFYQHYIENLFIYFQ